MIKYYECSYANILDNFSEMGKFPERQKQTKVTQEEQIIRKDLQQAMKLNS